MIGYVLYIAMYLLRKKVGLTGYVLYIRGGLGIADQAGVFKISFRNIFKEALAK